MKWYPQKNKNMNISTLEPNTYKHEYDVDLNFNILTNKDVLNNRLLCTFTTLEGIDELVKNLTTHYSIKYNKIFIFYIKDSKEYVVTYNIDQENIQIPSPGTILVHRKKLTNTLYTINALNELIKSLNGGVIDKSFPIKWDHYRNCILLTRQGEVKQLKTKIHKIINL